MSIFAKQKKCAHWSELHSRKIIGKPNMLLLSVDKHESFSVDESILLRESLTEIKARLIDLQNNCGLCFCCYSPHGGSSAQNSVLWAIWHSWWNTVVSYGRKLAAEVVSHITSVLMVWRMEPTGSNNGVVQISVANESVPAFKNIFKV